MAEEGRTLHIDIETFSSVDLKAAGVYKYSESPDFEILLIAYAEGQGQVRLLDLSCLCEGYSDYIQGHEDAEPVDVEAVRAELHDVLEMVKDPSIIKVAYNASFERICLSRYIYGKTNEFLAPEMFRCTMIMGCELSLPSSLEKLGKALSLPEDKQKLAIGKRLIKLFCTLNKDKKTGQRFRVYPWDEPEKWQMFREYCKQDVVTETEDHERIALFPMPASEWVLYCNSERINDAGIPADRQMIAKVMEYDTTHQQKLKERCMQLTGGIKPTELKQLCAWVSEQTGEVIKSLKKENVEALLERKDLPENVREVLEIRQEAGRASVKKYQAFATSMCEDGRIRGCFAFYGGRTGRYAGRLIQPQNFPRNAFDDMDLARQLVKDGDMETTEALYGSMSGVFSTLIRTLITAPEGKTFAVADYSAIEARVVAWVSGEKWRQEAFAKGRDIYCESASAMFGVRVEKHGENGRLRKQGKVAELACGYGGGRGAMLNFHADEMGLTEAEMDRIVRQWREASPKIVQLWKSLERAMKNAILFGAETELGHGIKVYMAGSYAFIRLPSGRSIAYPSPEVDDRGRISYAGTNGATQWARINTFGGKLTENLIQAIARDCLAVALLKLEKIPEYQVVMHVHDEVIVEVPEENAESHLQRIADIMGESIEWAPGLILRAEGFTSPYYKKD